MNIHTPEHEGMRRASRFPQCTSILLMAILAGGCREEKKNAPAPASPAPIPVAVSPVPVLQRDPLFIDIKGDNFDEAVRSKIKILALESPSFQKLVALVQSNPKILPYNFLDKKGILSFEAARGMSERNIMIELQDAGAFTSIQEDAIGVYLSEYVFTSKELFMEAIANEFLNIYFDAEMNSTLQKKKRSVDSKGGISFTEDDVNGLGIEITKEFLSGFISTALVRKYSGNNETYSLQALKQNLINGKFDGSNEPGYAFAYTSRILVIHGFPHPRDHTQLIRFHQHIVSLIWPNISQNLKSFCQYFEIPVKE